MYVGLGLASDDEGDENASHDLDRATTPREGW
jgi:hypothetical protein